MNDLNVDNKKLIDAMKMMRENPTEIVKNEFLEQVFYYFIFLRYK